MWTDTGDVCAEARGQREPGTLEVLRDESAIGRNDPSERSCEERTSEIKAGCFCNLCVRPSIKRNSLR